MNPEAPIFTAARRQGRLRVKCGLGTDHLRLAAFHQELTEELGHLCISAPPTLRDKARVLDATFRYLDRHADQWQGGRPALRQSLLAFLERSAYDLSRNTESLEKLFRRKQAAWQSLGKTVDVIMDARKGRAGRPRRRLCADCDRLLTAAAVELDGNVSMAFRRLHTRGAFCAVCAASLPFDPMHKSYVPLAIRLQIGPAVDQAMPFRRGPDHARQTGPYVRRIPDFAPGDVFIADDFTWNHAWWFRSPDGRVHVCRGECLLAADERTQYPLRYVLISSPALLPGDPEFTGKPGRASYTSRDCRLLLLGVLDSLGMPHKEFKLENGNWKKGFMDDLPRTGWDAIPWRDASEAMCAGQVGFTLQYVKPRSPTAKAHIERMGGFLQEMMRCDPAFIGFNQRLDKREDVEGTIRAVRPQKLAPEESGLPSMEQMIQILDRVLTEFRQEKQNGVWLPGVSPQDAWLDGIENPGQGHRPGIRTRPLRQWPPELPYYLATYKTVKRIGDAGLRVKNDVYWGPELEPFKHQDVEVRVDMEDTSIAYVSLPGSTKWVAVKAQRQMASTANRYDLTTAARDKAAFTRPARVLFDGLEHPLRFNLVDDNAHGTEEDKAVGRSISAARDGVLQERDAGKCQQRELERLARQAGCVVPLVTKNPNDLKQLYQRRIASRAGEPKTTT